MQSIVVRVSRNSWRLTEAVITVTHVYISLICHKWSSLLAYLWCCLNLMWPKFFSVHRLFLVHNIQTTYMYSIIDSIQWNSAAPSKPVVEASNMQFCNKFLNLFKCVKLYLFLTNDKSIFIYFSGYSVKSDGNIFSQRICTIVQKDCWRTLEIVCVPLICWKQ